jgi:hypothetical protein
MGEFRFWPYALAISEYLMICSVTTMFTISVIFDDENDFNAFYNFQIFHNSRWVVLRLALFLDPSTFFFNIKAYCNYWFLVIFFPMRDNACHSGSKGRQELLLRAKICSKNYRPLK